MSRNLRLHTVPKEKKDKKKVIGENFTDEHLRVFLDLEPPEGVDRAYHRLERAYRSLPATAFRTFMQICQQEDLPLNPTDPNGRSFLQLLSSNASQLEYVKILKNFIPVR